MSTPIILNDFYDRLLSRIEDATDGKPSIGSFAISILLHVSRSLATTEILNFLEPVLHSQVSRKRTTLYTEALVEETGSLKLSHQGDIFASFITQRENF